MSVADGSARESRQRDGSPRQREAHTRHSRRGAIGAVHPSCTRAHARKRLGVAAWRRGGVFLRRSASRLEPDEGTRVPLTSGLVITMDVFCESIVVMILRGPRAAWG